MQNLRLKWDFFCQSEGNFVLLTVIKIIFIFSLNQIFKKCPVQIYFANYNEDVEQNYE